MHFSKLVGVCRGCIPVTLEGIGDEPMASSSDGYGSVVRRSPSTSLRGTKIDQHASFPKGLPRAFHLHDEHIRD